jgi:hypothetical protein
MNSSLPVAERIHVENLMVMGFATSWPVNRWLLRHGIKEHMATV